MTGSQSPMLFHKALQRAIGPLDAEHLAQVIIISTTEDDLGTEALEYEFLLFLIIHEIRSTESDQRSFKNIDNLINPDDPSNLEAILKHTDAWKQPNEDNLREMVLAGIKDRLMVVMLADDPRSQEKAEV
ncbi:MAG: hypothetical protein K2W95_13530 [Candidatus Obscuribacterales bacterium]|nr:hypothetical protein [Candidatus Obscuribacterales bacterium]